MSFSMGKGTYLTDEQPNIQDWAGSEVAIGNYCSIAPDVVFVPGGEHHPEYVTTSPFGGVAVSKGPIVVQHDVWIGTRAIILSGVHIGTGAVIGAGAVVTKNVEPYSIVAGNPARLIRYRFSPSQIQRLLSTEWWDWPEERVQENLHLLLSSDVEAFLASACPDSPDQTGEP